MSILIGVAAKAAMVGAVATSPHAPAHAHEVVVKAGDTLSAIAEHNHVPGGWSSIFAANRAKIHNADLIFPKQVLKLPDHAITAAATTAAVTRDTEVSDTHPADQFDGHHDQCGDGDGDGMDMPCSLLHHNHAAVSGSASSSTESSGSSSSASVGGTYHGSGSMEQCIISRESGGNSQVMNSSGHYGLYQFSESTWIASGGSAATFGNASVAEQQRVFQNAVAARGYSDWTPYDGC